MPLSPKALKNAEALEERYRSRIESNPDAPDYDVIAEKLNSLGTMIDEHYKSQRKTDDSGRVTQEYPTRLPASVEGNPESEDTDYFYEPNVTEAQEFFRRNPESMKRLGLANWAGGINTPEKREAVLDPMSGAPQGWNVVPAVTYLDALKESDSQYGTIADEMYRQRSEEAQRYGANLKRYRDVKFQPGQKVDYLRGGAGWVGDRVVAPAVMGAADAASFGQASPLGDVMTELIDYELGKRGIDIGPQPKARDVINRNKPAYIAGNFAGYGLPRNPANLIQGTLADVGNTLAQQAIGKAANTAIPRALVAAGSGAITNTLEGAAQDFSTRAAESGAGDFLGKDLGESVDAATGNMGMNAITGGGLSFATDLGASGINSLRQAYRAAPRNRPIQTLEAAGGGAHVGKGVTAPKEIRDYYDASNEIGAHGTAGDRAAEAVAPDIERSIINQADKEQSRIEKESQEYYQHPDYRDIEHPVTPAIQSLVDIVDGSFGRSSIDGSRIPADPPLLKKIGGIINEYAQPVPVASADAPALASTTGGILIDGEVAKHLFGDEVAANPSQMVLLRPIKVNAQGLTAMEGRIDRELGFSANRGDPRDPVWNRFNRGIKQTRDQFPLYRDAEGKLVAPPPESVRPEPFQKDPGAVPPEGEMRVLNPPEPIARGPQRKPEGLMGIGPGGPPIPENPFDPRLPVARERVSPQQTVDVQGEYGPVPPLDPKARMGIGDIRRFEQFEPFEPHPAPIEVTGGEYAQPLMLSQPDRLGTGRGRDPRDMLGPSVEPIPTQQIQGSYNRPPRVDPDKAPTTERNPYGHVNRGQPEPEVPLPPSERNPYASQALGDDSLSLLAGNELAMREPVAKPAGKELAQGDLSAAIKASTDDNGLAMVPDVVKAYGGDVEAAHRAILDAESRGAIELRPEGGLNRLSPEEMQLTIPGPGGMALSNIRVIDEPLSRGQFAVLDQMDGIPREKTFATLAEAEAEAKRLGAHFKAPSRFAPINEQQWRTSRRREMSLEQQEIEDFLMGKTDANPGNRERPIETAGEEVLPPERGLPRPDERGGLEQMLDAQLEKAPKVDQAEIDEIGALQTADREQVARDQKAYVEDLFSPGSEARAREVAKVKKLAESQQAIEEAMAQINKVRLDLTDEMKREMLAQTVSKKLGESISVEDLIRAGLIASGMVQLATSDSEQGKELGAALAGMSFFGMGRGKKSKESFGEPEPAKPAKPKQIEFDDNGEIRRGFSALRAQQHDRLTAIDKAKSRIGVGRDQSVEDRIRTFGQQGGRYGTDKTLLEEAKKIGKERELRAAAGAAVYPHLKGRSMGGGNDGVWNKVFDFFGFRGYKVGELLAGRFDNDNMRNPFVRRAEATPFWSNPSSYAERIQQSLLEDPSRRLLDLSRGSPGARHGDDIRRIIEALQGNGYYEENDQQPSP